MIRKLERKDKENWIKLYCGYAKFYKVPMNQEILDTFGSGFIMKLMMLMQFVMNLRVKL
jgi:hypothetical protein